MSANSVFEKNCCSPFKIVSEVNLHKKLSQSRYRSKSVGINKTILNLFHKVHPRCKIREVTRLFTVAGSSKSLRQLYACHKNRTGCTVAFGLARHGNAFGKYLMYKGILLDMNRRYGIDQIPETENIVAHTAVRILVARRCVKPLREVLPGRMIWLREFLHDHTDSLALVLTDTGPLMYFCILLILVS